MRQCSHFPSTHRVIFRLFLLSIPLKLHLSLWIYIYIEYLLYDYRELDILFSYPCNNPAFMHPICSLEICQTVAFLKGTIRSTLVFPSPPNMAIASISLRDTKFACICLEEWFIRLTASSNCNIDAIPLYCAFNCEIFSHYFPP